MGSDEAWQSADLQGLLQVNKEHTHLMDPIKLPGMSKGMVPSSGAGEGANPAGSKSSPTSTPLVSTPHSRDKGE